MSWSVVCHATVHASLCALTFSLNIFSETAHRILMKLHRNVPAMVLFRISWKNFACRNTACSFIQLVSTKTPQIIALGSNLAPPWGHNFYVGLLCPPSKKRGYLVYCFALVGRSVRRPHFCPQHNSKSISVIILKLHRWIDFIKEKCSAQES